LYDDYRIERGLYNPEDPAVKDLPSEKKAKTI
jgi:hypothetical protein